jgi:hypothetical protein
MPIRFRKTITLFPGVRLNLSKSGMSLSVGKRGAFTLNFSKRGVRQTTDLPGEGLYHTSYLFKDNEGDKDKGDNKSSPEKEARASEDADDRPKRPTRRSSNGQKSSPWGFFLFVFIALFFIYFGADALGLLPPNLLTNFLQTLAHWARQIGL